MLKQYGCNNLITFMIWGAEIVETKVIRVVNNPQGWCALYFTNL